MGQRSGGESDRNLKSGALGLNRSYSGPEAGPGSGVAGAESPVGHACVWDNRL
jgi:hypothetical protein